MSRAAWLLGLLLLARLDAAASFTVDGTVADYDLAAVRPWMPVLWQPCVLVLPQPTMRVRWTAQLAGADATDLLALRDGHLLSVTSDRFRINAGTAWVWSGPVAGPATLTATIDAPVDAATALLAIRQLHYANLGGVRSLAQRTLTVQAAYGNGSVWTPIIPAVTISMRPGAVEVPPRLRFEALSIPVGGSAAWEPVGWWSGRREAAAAIWLLTDADGVDITAAHGGSRVSSVAALMQPPGHPLTWFAGAQLRLEGGETVGPRAPRLVVTDGGHSAVVRTPVQVNAADGALLVIGDIPLVADPGPLSVHLVASQPISDVTASAAPGSPDTHLAPASINRTAEHVRLDFVLPPDLATDYASGLLVLTAGSQSVTIPYRIRLRRGPAN